jgi:hypothetical protein
MLSFGGGQDSTAILYKMIYDKSFREKYAPNDLIVVMADTGNEHKATDIHVKGVSQLCENHNIPFFLINCNSQYYTGDWKGGYINFLESGNRIGSKAYPKTCTDKLKIQPIYKFLDNHIFHEYMSVAEKIIHDYSSDRATKLVKAYENDLQFSILKKDAIKTFAKMYGKIDVILGIAAGEESRLSDAKDAPQMWMRESIVKVYPLIDLGMDRQACQDYIASTGFDVPPPSNCILCPFLSLQELLYMHRFNITWYNKFVELEQAKVDANKDKVEAGKNFGVWGAKLIPEKLVEAIEKFGHMSDYELREYKMSHGHCVKSKY